MSERRLVAILAADLVGYTSLLAADEAGTLAQLRALRDTAIDPQMAAHGGRIFKTTGDGFLAEFPSAVQALRCAIAIQTQDRPPEAPRLRIGLHQGDVVVEGDDLFGDSVNIAARLETLAEPGGICISARLREDAAGKIDLQTDDLGEPALKNVAQRLRVFRVRLNGAPPMSVPPTALPDRWSEKPAIAILPFRNTGAADAHDHLADSITDDLITAISGWRVFPVIARNSVFAQDGETDRHETGRRLGARYIVSGSLRPFVDALGGAQIRVRAELVDVESAAVLMAEQFDHAARDPMRLPDEIVLAIAGVLAPEIARQERDRAARRPRADAGAHELVRRGLWHRNRNTREDLEAAETLFLRALDIDPDYAPALSALSIGRNFAAIRRWARDVPAAFRESLDFARRSIAADPRDPQSHFALGIANMNLGHRPEAVVELREAIRLNPSHAAARANLGQVFNYLNRPDEALPELEIALRLSPHDPYRYQWLPYVAASHYLAGRYRECLAASQEALQSNPDYPLAIRYVAAALGQLGHAEQAAGVLPLIQRIDGSFARLEAMTRRLFVRPAADHLLEGFAKAGFA